jgi:enamine deaminase RidA (YjgF/YER057c/UK114 family)
VTPPAIRPDNAGPGSASSAKGSAAARSGANDAVTERALIPTRVVWAETVGYSRAVRVGDTIYVSGTAPVAEDGDVAFPGDAYRQARRCLEIIVEALRAAGAGPEHVVRTRMFAADAGDWEDIGRAHGEFFRDVRPATTLVGASGFVDPAIRVEIEATAVL